MHAKIESAINRVPHDMESCPCDELGLQQAEIIIAMVDEHHQSDCVGKLQ